jgi:hypothetical protein
MAISHNNRAKTTRHDGWTYQRRSVFLDVLGHTGCVRDACNVAGISSTSAYRLRRIDAQFETAWRTSLARAQKGLEAVAYKHAVIGRETIIIRKGEEVERRITPSDAMLSLLIKRGALSPEISAAKAQELSEKTLTFEEYKDNWIFDDKGNKLHMPSDADMRSVTNERIALVHQRMREYAQSGGGCPCCYQQLPENWPQQSVMEMSILGVVNIWDNRDGWGGMGPTKTRADPVDVFIPPLR